MMDEKMLKQAQTVFNTMCKAFDSNGWKYEKDDEKLQISCGAQGNDLTIDVNMKVNVPLQIISFYSYMPFEVPQDRRVEVALAVTMINYVLVDGSFDYDFVEGTLLFRMTSGFTSSLIGQELVEYMLYISCRTVDDYNDKLEKIANGKMSLQELAELIHS